MSDGPSQLAQVTTPDGYALRYRTWSSDQSPARATIVLFNGVMSHSGWFEPLARPLAERGFDVIGADRRGTGANEAARGDAPSAKALVDDAKAIIERARTRPILLAGWCWGAVLAINVAFEMAPRPAGLLLLAPGLFSTDALKARMAAQEAVARASREDEPCLESPIAEAMFTSGPALEGFILKDGLRLRAFTPRFHQIMAKMGMSAQIRLPKLDVPIALILAANDAATDNAAT